MKIVYFNEHWADYVREEGTEAQGRLMAFVDMSPKSMRSLRGKHLMGGKSRIPVCVTLIPAHAKRVNEFRRGDKSALVNRTLCRGWLWPTLMKFTKMVHQENEDLKLKLKMMEENK